MMVTSPCCLVIGRLTYFELGRKPYCLCSLFKPMICGHSKRVLKLAVNVYIELPRHPNRADNPGARSTRTNIDIVCI
jgi:hypothetical protein